MQSFSSANIGLFYPAIPPFDTPLLSDRVIRVRITSNQAQDNWTFAGSAKQVVNAGGVDSVKAIKSFELNDSILWELVNTQSYRLRVKLPRYFKQATVSIFGYTGD